MKKKYRVVCVFGDIEGSDFVLEKACSEECKCEICKEAFYIQVDIKEELTKGGTDEKAVE